MDERHIAAAAAIIEGKTVEEAAKAAHRTPETLHKWAEDPEFQAVVLRGIKASALLTLAQYVRGGVEPKVGQAALVIMKWMGATRSRHIGKPRGSVEEEDTDLDEFSEENYSAEQLERLKGDG